LFLISIRALVRLAAEGRADPLGCCELHAQCAPRADVSSPRWQRALLWL